MERPSKLSADDHPVIIIAEPRFRVLNGLFAAPRIIKIKTAIKPDQSTQGKGMETRDSNFPVQSRATRKAQQMPIL